MIKKNSNKVERYKTPLNSTYLRCGNRLSEKKNWMFIINNTF